MAAKSFWNVGNNPNKPTGKFDPHETLWLTWDWTLWLDQHQTTRLSHLIIVPEQFEIVNEAVENGTVAALIRVLEGQAVVIGQSYPVTCRLTSVDGQVKDQTVYLKIFNN